MDREELVKNKTVEKDETGQGKQGRENSLENVKIAISREFCRLSGMKTGSEGSIMRAILLNFFKIPF